VARQHGGFARARRRKTTWVLGPGGTAVTQLTSSGASLLGTTFEPASGNEDSTIIRTRGLFDAFLEGARTADGDGFFGAVGIAIATSAAVTAGIGSVPTPITEQSWDGWLWHSFFSVHQADITFAPGGSESQRIEIDSKAMRKHENAMTVYAAIEVVETGTAVLNVRLDTRQLIKLA